MHAHLHIYIYFKFIVGASTQVSTDLVHDELEGVDPGPGISGSLGSEVHSTVIAHLLNHNDEVDFVNKKWHPCTSD